MHNPTPPDAEKELDEILMTLNGQRYKIPEAKSRLLALIDAARIDSVQLYMDTCEKEGVPPSWRNVREFQRGQRLGYAELSHPAPATKSDKE